jgi:lipopolysaccharide transport system ATP-binding protein
MTDTVIQVEQLSKCYRIGHKEEQSDTLVGSAMNLMRRPLKNLNRLRNLSRFQDNENAEDIIWALKDISFEVKQGEVVGIIGRNGAGKSTLLKILSRITTPTYGRAIIRGRLASLLEVGTGFHPDLTGRENIYLNGSILGMPRARVDRLFDEIVDFSGVEKFIDTPVKRYSSGMHVRLGFAVATHIYPEILVIDEVLSVGDIAFQKKCLEKIQKKKLKFLKLKILNWIKPQNR